MLRRPSLLRWLRPTLMAAAMKRRQEPAELLNGLIVLIMAWLVTWFASPAGAGETEPPEAKSPYQVKVWTTEDGLPQHEISCLKQTRDGYLWIGTRFGLARFDGVRFASFDESTTPEIINESVDALAEDSEQTLWIGTAGGLLSYNNQRFARVHIPGQEKQSVRRLCASSRRGLWLCTMDSRIFHLLKGQISLVWTPTESNEDDVISLCEGTNGWLNVFTKGKWLTISSDATQIRTNALCQAAVTNWTAALPGIDSNHAWVGTKQGMFELNGESWKPVAEPALATNSVELIFQDRSGNIWAGSRNGMFGKWGSHWQPVDLGDVVEKSSGICMEEDAEGSLWVATEGGLVQLRESPAIVYTKSDGITHNKVWSICQEADGKIWVGTEHGLCRIDKSGGVQAIAVTGRVANPADRCVWPRRGGGVWTAKNNMGLYGCINDAFVPAAPAELLDYSPITCLAAARAGLLYVCTEKAIFGFNQEGPLPWTNQTLRIDVPAVRSLWESSDGTIWMGTDGNGVARQRKGDVVYFGQKSGLLGNHVWSILEYGDNTLWFGTDKGLSRYQNGMISSLTREQGLLEDRINCILADDDGYFWLSGLSGIYRVQIAELNAVADGKASRVHTYAVGTAEGLKSAETNGEKQPAGWKATDGRLWFPTVRGVVVIDPKKFPTNEKPPPVIIEQIIVDGTIVNQNRTNSANSVLSNIERSTFYHRIRAGHGHVEFQYTATSLIDAKRIKFRYRLIGADSDWREETRERSARYVSLRPGNYRFQLKAANHHNVWTPEPVEFAFSLAPYFWQTKAFYGVSAAAVLAMVAGIQAYRLRWQHRLLKLEQQRALAAERARIARDLHDDLGTALTGLALELDVIGRDPKPDSPVVQRLGQTAQRTRALAERMREVVWSVNPHCDTVSSLASFLEQQISQFLRAGNIKVELDFPEDIPALPIGGDARHQLALGVREALTNVVRHAHATNVILSLAIDPEWLVVRVKDNGRGLGSSNRNGDGLRNMRDRLQSIGGTFDFTSEPGSGTTITFRVPLIKPNSKESI